MATLNIMFYQKEHNFILIFDNIFSRHHTQTAASPVSSCVFVKSDGSMHNPPGFSHSR